MSDPKHRGILVCVDGSAESDAAVAWAAREAAMRGLPITVIHAVAPVVVGWPVGQLYADMPAWQQDGAQQVIDQARKIVIANQRGGTPPEMRTEIIYSAVTPTLIDASRDAWMIVAGSQGSGRWAGCCWVRSPPHSLRMRTARWRSSTPMTMLLAPPTRPCWWVPTGHLPGGRDRPGVRRSVSPGRRRGGATRLERRRRVSHSRHGLARQRGEGRGTAGRAAGRLAGTVPGRACEAIGRVRQALSVAGRGSRARSTSRRRQPRTGRVPRHAAGFGQLACRAIGDGAGDRGPWAVTVRHAHRMSGWLLSAPPLRERPTKVCRPCGWGRKSPDRPRFQT